MLTFMETPVNPTPIYSTLAHDADFLDLIEMYVEDVPDFIQRLTEASIRKAWDEVGSVAHEIKGSAGGHGYQQVTDAACRLDRACKENASATEILNHLQELVGLMKRLRVSPNS